MRRRKCVSASRVAPVCGFAFRIGSLAGILGMDVHNRAMCLLVWAVQEVEEWKVGCENYGSPLMVSSLSRSYRANEGASEQTLKLAKVGAASS